jgi:hypothetical protein
MLEGYHSTAISALIMKTMGADCSGAIIGINRLNVIDFD